FEHRVGRAPESVALVYEDRRLTYAELNARANRLANYLKRLGVGPDTLVGVCVDRNPEMVVGLLGILKAGGAYLPIHPAYPAERIRLMLEDSQAKVLLTEQRLLESLPANSSHTVTLDGDWQTIEAERIENLLSGAAADNLAYVIYTSGSTGRPKGVSA